MLSVGMKEVGAAEVCRVGKGGGPQPPGGLPTPVPKA